MSFPPKLPDDAKSLMERAYDDFEQRIDNRADYVEGSPNWYVYVITYQELRKAAGLGAI